MTPEVARHEPNAGRRHDGAHRLAPITGDGARTKAAGPELPGPAATFNSRTSLQVAFASLRLRAGACVALGLRNRLDLRNKEPWRVDREAIEPPPSPHVDPA